MLCFFLPFIIYNVGIFLLKFESMPPREQQKTDTSERLL